MSAEGRGPARRGWDSTISVRSTRCEKGASGTKGGKILVLSGLCLEGSPFWKESARAFGRAVEGATPRFFITTVRGGVLFDGRKKKGKSQKSSRRECAIAAPGGKSPAVTWIPVRGIHLEGWGYRGGAPAGIDGKTRPAPRAANPVRNHLIAGGGGGKGKRGRLTGKSSVIDETRSFHGSLAKPGRGIQGSSFRGRRGVYSEKKLGPRQRRSFDSLEKSKLGGVDRKGAVGSYTAFGNHLKGRGAQRGMTLPRKLMMMPN